MPRLTITGIAAQVGVHKSTVSRQVAKNNLLGADGLVDLDAYLALRQGLDPGFQTTGAGAVALPSARTEGLDISEERLRKLAADRERAELELATRKGELVRIDEVAGEQEDVFRQLRDALMQLPRLLGEQLAEIDQPNVIESRVRRALNGALRTFAESLEQDADAAGRAGQRQSLGAEGGSAGAQAAA